MGTLGPAGSGRPKDLKAAQLYAAARSATVSVEAHACAPGARCSLASEYRLGCRGVVAADETGGALRGQSPEAQR